MREEIVKLILSHINVNPSCVSRRVFTVLNPVSNSEEVFSKMSRDVFVRNIHNDMIKQFDDGELVRLFYYVTHK